MSLLKGTILVTGSNGGLGSNIVSKIVNSPEFSRYYYGIYTVRTAESAGVVRRILSSGPQTHQHDVVALDLGRLESVRQVANDINRRVANNELPPIRALILNAGYQEQTTQTFSPDGFDMSFQANYLSHWLLTLKLLQGLDAQRGRVVIVGSWTHDAADKRNRTQGLYDGAQWKTMFHDTESLAKGTWSPPEDSPTVASGMRRYGAGKLCEVMMMHELQQRLNQDSSLSNISVLAVDPGAMATSITKRGGWLMRVLLMKILMPLLAPIALWLDPNGILRSPAKSAGDVLRAAFDTEALGEHPKELYLDGSQISRSGAEAREPKKREMLWKDSVVLGKLDEKETVLEKWN